MSEESTMIEKVARVETATEKLRTLRNLCDACSQPLYVEILDEVLASFEEPNVEGILEVRPCIGRHGHIVSYDLCPPHEEGATGGPVFASVYAGEEAANKIAAAWNTRAAIEAMPLNVLREALEVIANAKDLDAPSDFNRGWNDSRYRLRSIARAALERAGLSGQGADDA